MTRNIDDSIKTYLTQDIRIPESILAKAEVAFEQIRSSEKTKSASFLGFKKQIVAAAAAILITVTSIGITYPDIVKAFSGIKSIFKLINYGNIGENLGKLEQFSTSVNKSVEKNGIKITINEITIDDNTLAITSTEEGKNLRENVGFMGGIKLNDKVVKGYSSKDKKVDDNTLTTVTYANISDLALPDTVVVALNIVWVDNVKGPWDFKFNVTKSDKPTNSKVISLGKTLKIPNSTFKIDNIVLSPLGNTLNYSGSYDKINESMENGIFNLIVMDDRGRVLQTKFGGSGSNKEKYEGKIEIFNDLSNTKFLTVVPIFKQWGIKMIDIDNFPYPILQTTINSANFTIPQETMTSNRRGKIKRICS